MWKVLLILSLGFILGFGSDYERANSASRDALKGLDCEFEDCSKKPQVIIKEKQVVVEKVVYKERPREEVEPVATTVKKQPVDNRGKEYNKAFFDMHPSGQSPILDYISFSNSTSFNTTQFIDSVSKIASAMKVYIYGKIEIPDDITTDEIYITAGEDYKLYDCCDYDKKIFYNGGKQPQNADIFAVNVKQDRYGHRYIDYKISIYYEHPRNVAKYERSLPNSYKFQVAPKVRSYKNKFVPVRLYITEE